MPDLDPPEIDILIDHDDGTVTLWRDTDLIVRDVWGRRVRLTYSAMMDLRTGKVSQGQTHKEMPHA